MKSRSSLLLAALLLVSSLPSLAGEPVTIPLATYEAMKKGKKLNRVWQAPGFDGSQGFQLGKLSNESEDEASAVLQDFPIVMRSSMRAGSPYTLHLAVIGVRTSEKAGGLSSARVDVEGRVVDRSGKLVAAFETRASATIGGNKRDNIRFAVKEIAFGIAKDLFPVGLPSNEKAPAVIVAAPDHGAKATAATAVVPADQKPSGIIVPAPMAVPPAKPAVIMSAAPVAAAPPPVASTEVVPPVANAPQPAPKAPAVVTAPPPAAPVPPPVPVVAPAPNLPAVQPESPLAETLPASIIANMKPGSALDGLWLSPAYDRARGFSIGEVRYLIDQREDAVTAYLPIGLDEIAKKEAPCALYLGITGLSRRPVVGRTTQIRIKVEGRLIASDGTIIAAFNTAESVQTTDDISTSYRQLARKVVLAIDKDLR